MIDEENGHSMGKAADQRAFRGAKKGMRNSRKPTKLQPGTIDFRWSGGVNVQKGKKEMGMIPNWEFDREMLSWIKQRMQKWSPKSQ